MTIREAYEKVLPMYELNRRGLYKAITKDKTTYDAGFGMLGDVLKDVIKNEWWYGETSDIYDGETGEIVWIREAL